MPRCRHCVYVPDEDEWICEVCGALAPRALADTLTRSLLRLVHRSADDELEDEQPDFDADELGLDPEPEE